MNGQDVCRALGDKANGLIKFINRVTGSDMLYIESDLGFYRLYSNSTGRDQMILDGRNSIGDLARLVTTLQAILAAIDL